jgi:uncharacterized membrane protein
MSIEDDRALILAAAKYRSGNDSCNAFYMGSMATCELYFILGAPGLPNIPLENILAKATPAQIEKAKTYAKPYIDYMIAHPVKVCPCCGQITGTDRGSP